MNLTVGRAFVQNAGADTPSRSSQFTCCDFFSGGGMVRAGLGGGWECVFANDFDLKKSAIYRENWGDDSALTTKDVLKVEAQELPDRPDLVWASFPCQDLSLAGMGAGLWGDRSGTFWPFWNLITQLDAEERGPRMIVLENVCGTLTSHGGKDFTAIADVLAMAGYRFGALVIDAELFVPQSRPRLFVLAVASGVNLPTALIAEEPSPVWHTRALRIAHERLSSATRDWWTWWRLPIPPKRIVRLRRLIEEQPQGVPWHSAAETTKLLGMMSPKNLAKVRDAKKFGRQIVGTVYKRTRHNEDGEKVQRAEIGFDGRAGCLRTPAGGSSHQIIVVVEGATVRSRLISARETARLMGLPDTYVLPGNYNEAYNLTGDGVVVPVVRHLAAHLIEPALAAAEEAPLAYARL